MPTPLLIRADAKSPCNIRDSLQEIQAEYLAWVHGHMTRYSPAPADQGTGMPQPEGYVDIVQTLCATEPLGNVLYLIEVDGKAAGMCGLRRLGGNTAEIKRMYVRPAYRGKQIGAYALRGLLTDASRWGVTVICLDTALFMQTAHRLYEAYGFTECAAYEGSEVPAALHGQWRFMQLVISQTSP